MLFILCLPLAILLGYLLSDPLDRGNTLLIALMIGVMSIPVLMRGYHPLLIFAWNAAITPFFLPGQPFLWVPLCFLGLGFAVVNRFINPEAHFISVPSLTKPLLFLLIAVLGVGFTHGGFGLRSFGSGSYGGRNYIYVIAAILGYFAFASQALPRNKARFYVGLFFLMGVTALIPNLAYLGGRPWYFLFYLFPPAYAMEQAMGDYSIEVQIARTLGLTAASVAVLCWVLARHGLGGVFNLRKPRPLLFFLAAVVGCVFCGFRIVFAIFAVTLAAQFWFEGLYRRKGLVAALFSLCVIGGALLATNAERLPLVAQRTLSVLPIQVNPIAERSAEGSTLWRLEMWKELLPEVPKYLLTGKGFGIDPTELAFANANARYGYTFAGAIASGDYHSGPLSLVIPLGIWGVIGFGWFAVAALGYLLRQYRHGDPHLRTINTFLLSYFVARLFIFIFVFGGFFSDLFIFTGIVGLSVSLNGAALPEAAQAKAESESEDLAHQEQLASERAR